MTGGPFLPFFSPRFLLTIDGRNCLIDVDGSRMRVGFVTTRLLEGRTAEEAAYSGLARVNDELKEQLLNEPEDPPRIWVSGVQTVSPLRLGRRPKGGFTFFTGEET